MSGVNDAATGMALAKQLLMQCEGDGDITLPKETLRIALFPLIQSWHGEQDKKRSEFKKAVG